jgi:hypothetical protein
VAGLLRGAWDTGLLAGWTGVQPLDQNLHFVFGNRSARRNRADRLARLPPKNRAKLSRKADGSLAERIGLLSSVETFDTTFDQTEELIWLSGVL